MEVKVFLICAIGLVSSLSLTSCSAITSDYNDSPNILGQVISAGYAGNLAQYFETFLQADVVNASNETNLLSGTTGDFQLPFFSSSRDPNGTCVTVTDTNSGSDIDELFTYNCPYNTGTVEAKSSDGTAAENFEVITNMNLVGVTSPNNTETIASDYTVSVIAGVMTITKQFDDTFATVNNTYEAKGNSSAVVTTSGSTIQVSSTLQYLVNGNSYGTVAVTSSGLAYSSCGLNAGSITFADGGTTMVTTFNGCGIPTLTSNGSAITWP